MRPLAANPSTPEQQEAKPKEDLGSGSTAPKLRFYEGGYAMTPDYSHWRRHGIVGKLIHVRIADMKNDVELTRAILMSIRERENLRPAPVVLHDYEPVLVMRHVKRLYDDEMIEGRVSEAIGMEAPMVLVTDMTTAGHNLLASLEDKQIWERLKSALSPEELAQVPIKTLAKIAWELAEKKIRSKFDL